jgi:septum site-determining protein MinC
MPAKRLTVQIKGIRDGLLITVGDGEWEELQREIIKHVEEKAAFFKGAKISLEVGNRALEEAELTTLRDKLTEQSVTLWAVLGNSLKTEKAAQTLGLATRLPSTKPDPERNIQTLQTNNIGGESGIFIHRTLRSGFKISFEGHVTIIGDVNPGAEIIAGGNIVIWGRLRGLAHAGATGDNKAVVCALDLNPMQLRIADLIAIPPKHRGKPIPEIASIQNGQVVAEPWDIGFQHQDTNT